MDPTPPRQTSPATYFPRRRPFRHRQRRSLADADTIDGLPPTNTTSPSIIFGPPPPSGPVTNAAPHGSRTSSTATRRRSLLATYASSIGPACPFGYQPQQKRRKIEDYSRPQGGTKLLRLSLAYCDGGTYEGERYRIGNMLVDDDSVYCTERYSCNIVLQHETKQPFTLEWLEIKAPPHGFTSPVSEGVIAVTDDDYNGVVEKISSYGRMVPLKRRIKRVRLRRLVDLEGGTTEVVGEVEGRNGGEAEEEEEIEEDYLDGERVTEFDILSQYRRDEEEDKEDDEEEDDDEEVEGGGDGDEGERELEEGGNAGETDEDVLEEAQLDGTESDGDNDTITPATSAEFAPWPPLGSRRLPGLFGLGRDENDDGTAQHDCPYDIPGDEDTEVEADRLELEGDSSEDELRQWLLRNNTQDRRRRQRRREQEEEAEREYAPSEIDGANEETYMRFQLRDNKTCIVFNPPRYCKHIVIKLWGSKIDNVDIQSILGYGYYGKRVFPAVEMR
ncbi:hypothetical protein TWF694_007346 [Orbilia ellipsospora]|uniref:Uncharacterized protein n=1 Tax=Orbilia ellipsospora TaxID=2528407 RepID=A0AAV9XHE6_9PEZI